jgi:hypothetical protein
VLNIAEQVLNAMFSTFFPVIATDLSEKTRSAELLNVSGVCVGGEGRNGISANIAGEKAKSVQQFSKSISLS